MKTRSGRPAVGPGAARRRGRTPPRHPRGAGEPRLDTAVIHAGEGARPGASPLTTPIYATSTSLFETAAALEAYHRGGSAQYLYSRHANPTVEAVEQKLAILDGAGAALLTSSGMAAVALALFGLLASGDEVVASAEVYGGTRQLLAECLARFGVQIRFVPREALATPGKVIGPSTKMVWFETPANPTMRCVDIRRVARACRAAGVLSVLDNTFASPVNQRPLALGIDLAMQSATKYLNGHSDLVAGVLTGPRALIDRLRRARLLFGGVVDPVAAAALARGLKTLPVRMARHNANGLAVARWLAADARVAAVWYPGLRSHPDYAIARRQMRGFGGMLAFEPAGGYAAACRLYDRLRIIRRAASLGGTESLCSLPVLTSHHGVSDADLRAAGISRGLVRLSVGLEHPDDLIADLDQALGPRRRRRGRPAR
jgi:cystathionine beta-lyase/cystathionine gamma-synthase